MSVNYNVSISNRGLVFAVDAANISSLPSNMSKNLFVAPENFTNWTPISLTLQPNTVTSPERTLTATTITNTTDTSQHTIRAPSTVTIAGKHTFSIFFKAGTIDDVGIVANTSQYYRRYNLRTGTTTNWFGTLPDSSGIIPCGDGWYRLWFVSFMALDEQIIIYLIKNDQFSYAGSTSDSVYVWGAQLEEGTTLTPYYSENLPDDALNTRWYDLTNTSRPYATGTNLFDYRSYGTLLNKVKYDTRNKGSLVFNNSSSYVSFPELPAQTNSPLSVFSWVFLNSTPATVNGIWGHYGVNNNCHFECYSTYTRIRLGNVNNIALPVMSTGVWRYVGFTSDGITHNYYVNGEIIASWSGETGTILGGSGSLPSGHMIGRSDANRVWNGRISNLTIYNTQLTDAEVKNNFNSIRGRYSV